MGCVAVGTGGAYALLVYDAQRTHWATVPITHKFSYSVSNLYISFHGTMLQPKEESGVSLSLLFSAKTDMTAFLRAMAAASIQSR